MNYRWEAEKNGNIITSGGDLSGCNRFSAIPTAKGFKRHDFTGLIFISRFNRRFKKTVMGNYKNMLFSLRDKATEKERFLLGLTLKKVELISKKYKLARKTEPANSDLHKHLKESTNAGMDLYKKLVHAIYLNHFPAEKTLFCAIHETGRIYVDSDSGDVLETEKDYELYI